MTDHALTGLRAGLVSCPCCGLLARPAAPARPGHCPRCGSGLAFRRDNAIQRTWALLIAAMIMYVPANVLPVLTTNTLVSSQSDTIMSGVVLLYETGSWPLALIVLVASVMIPLGKIVALAYVLVSVQRRSAASNRQRTRLYRTVEFIGRWSMLDVFVDTFVVALVQLSPLMSVEPGPGVVYFMAVVVLTMLAAASFDPRLIWDVTPPPQRRCAPPPPEGARALGRPGGAQSACERASDGH
ncbi:MAG: paraquat-inducible protein A [Burkholderiales bacterium]